MCESNKGLGGININHDIVTRDGKKCDNKIKENLVPQEILDNVDGLKQYIRKMKEYSGIIAKAGSEHSFDMEKEFQTIDADITKLNVNILNNKQFFQNLREQFSDLARTLKLLKQMNETPLSHVMEDPGFQNYFMELITKHEKDLEKLRINIENAEKQGHNLIYPQKDITTQDLIKCTQDIYDTFTTFSGRAYAAHSKVEALKLKMKQQSQLFPDTTKKSKESNC